MNGAAQVAQRSTDAFEDIAVQRFAAGRTMWVAIADAAKRADAVARLDAALRYAR